MRCSLSSENLLNETFMFKDLTISRSSKLQSIYFSIRFPVPHLQQVLKFFPHPISKLCYLLRNLTLQAGNFEIIIRKTQTILFSGKFVGFKEAYKQKQGKKYKRYARSRILEAFN
eukprot:TRINITY_DN8631_c0_g2_i1.p1 TRINITY_DN8631_c0_g2~~TRINITY_DN8631_c0_g2_i1.p1  ORF type:complete len:115 (+),score=2.11 TRINITY_DN8631_c0_g2_i1:142-486(+)